MDEGKDTKQNSEKSREEKGRRKNYEIVLQRPVI